MNLGILAQTPEEKSCRAVLRDFGAETAYPSIPTHFRSSTQEVHARRTPDPHPVCRSSSYTHRKPRHHLSPHT